MSVGDQVVAGLDVTMRQGVRISGEAIFTGAPLSVVSELGRIRISLQPTGAGFWRTLPGMLKPDLTFATAGDPPGRYILNVYSLPGWSWQSATLGGKPVIDDLIELRASDLSGLVITFAPTPTSVSGSVTDDTGAPDAGTDVIVFPADAGAWREGIFTRRRVQRVRATSAKAFEIAALAPGEYYIAAVSSRLTAQWQDPSFLERLVSGARRFTLAGSERKYLRLTTIIPRER